jgi:hypothetical protein
MQALRNWWLNFFFPSWPGSQPTLGRLRKLACPAIPIRGASRASLNEIAGSSPAMTSKYYRLA